MTFSCGLRAPFLACMRGPRIPPDSTDQGSNIKKTETETYCSSAKDDSKLAAKYAHYWRERCSYRKLQQGSWMDPNCLVSIPEQSRKNLVRLEGDFRSEGGKIRLTEAEIDF